ncbi:MAG TPA: winged helix-turn-helix domain-containing protein [Gammaproteobacteria bacterium]
MERAHAGGSDLWIGDWLVEPTLARVSKAGEVQRVTPRAMAVLLCLAEAQGTVVSRNEILDAVWPGMAVTPDALSQCLVELRRVFGDNPKQPGIIETIPKMGVRLVARVVQKSPASREADPGRPAPRAEAERRSLAVLPFDNLSADPSNAYVAAGMQEEILTRLARLANRFRVISRTSVLRYAAERPPIRTIAQELGADIILEGSVRSARDKLRIDARLIDAATDSVVWSDSYDGQRDDVLSMQSAVSLDVARALRVELSAAEKASLDRALTASTRAYELYAQANYLYTSVSPNEALARRLMESAVEADPTFAAALGWLAATDVLELVNTIQGDAVDPAGREQLVRAVRERAHRALEIDPHAIYASGALARVEFLHWRWTDALRSFDRALETAPSDLHSVGSGGWLNALVGRRERAIRIAEDGLALNPKIGEAHRWLGIVHGVIGNREAAVASLRAAHQIAPGDPFTAAWLAYVEIARGNAGEGARLLERTEQMLGKSRSMIFLAELALGYARVGREADARRISEEIQATGKRRPIGAGSYAMAAAAVGDYDEMLRWLAVAAAKVQKHEVDEGFIALNNLRMNITAEPALEQPRIRAALDLIRGD